MKKQFMQFLFWSPVLTVATPALAADDSSTHTAKEATTYYSYATNGLLDFGGAKLFLDESNLGGKELEMAELTFPAGSTGPIHTHGAVEILYVLSGIYGHEVNGRLYLLKPGMVGIVRPGDHVRHIVPKEADAKLLVIWAPAGEAQHIFDYTKGKVIQKLLEEEAQK